MNSSIVRTRNAANLDQPGHVDWSHGAPDGAATGDEHAAALRAVGAGWHPLGSLCRAGLGGRSIFRLLRADLLRYAGDDAAGDPVYLLMF